MSTSFATFSRSNDSQTASEISRTTARMDAAEMATKPGQQVETMQDKPMLPAQLIREEPEQLRRIQALREAADQFGYNKPNVTPELAEFIKRREEDMMYVDREKWIAKRFDLSSPEKAQWFNSIMPSFLERRRRFGEAKLGMQKQLFDITLYGPQKEEDIDFIWAIDNGKIDLEELSRPIWETHEDGTTDAAGYVAGMWATPKPLGGPQGSAPGRHVPATYRNRIGTSASAGAAYADREGLFAGNSNTPNNRYLSSRATDQQLGAPAALGF